ncbi:MAG: hypothetical protein ACE5JM_00780 [Armatimonadota bacterium]
MAILLAACGPGVAETGQYEPASNYEVQQMEGWTVHVNRALLSEENETLGRDTVEVLRQQLYQVNRVIPKPALERLHEVPIWVEAKSDVKCMCYHPSEKWLRDNGFNPAKARSIELGNPTNFLDWTLHQPWMLLHELTHAYHDRVLGDDNPDVLAAYERAKASKAYDSVLRHSGRKERAYAIGNHKEYLAELTEAYFGCNDWYPFVRAELKQHDPKGLEMVEKIWGR